MKKKYLLIILLSLHVIGFAQTITDSIISSQPPLKKSGFNFNAGEWNMCFTGSIGVLYNYTIFDGDKNVEMDAGVQVQTKTENSKHAHGIRNGKSPSSLIFKAVRYVGDSTQIKITIGTYYNLNTNSSTETSSIDVRQVNVSISNKKWGSVTLGRNYNFFGLDANVYDFDAILGGAGMPIFSKSPTSTTLGGVGAGYMFSDKTTQISYTTPLFYGFDLTAGVFSPYDLSAFSSVSYVGDTGSSSPGFTSRLRYTKIFSPKTNLYASSTFLSQENQLPTHKFTSVGYEIFGKLELGKFEFVGNYFNAKGLGMLLYMTDAADLEGKRRSSEGAFGQIKYSFGKMLNNSFGVYYGESKLSKTENDPLTLVKKAKKITFKYDYKLWDFMSVYAEYTNVKAENHQHQEIINHSIAIGTRVLFM